MQIVMAGMELISVEHPVFLFFRLVYRYPPALTSASEDCRIDGSLYVPLRAKSILSQVTSATSDRRII